VKENKEGADTEKAAEQDKESDKELVKEKVRICKKTGNLSKSCKIICI
jgi:hypothetical protein